MVGTSKRIITLACLAMWAFGSSTTVLAGVLDGHGDAIAPIWTGTQAFTNGGDLSGMVDYAVFTKADYIANFGTGDYNPVDGVVYTYQVFNTGVDEISAKIVGNTAESNSIGAFDDVVGGDKTPTSIFYDTGSPVWSFIGNSIGTGESSIGLAFSSPYLPVFGAGLVIDGGGIANVMGIPVPGSVAIPEPASWLLATMGMAAFGWFRRFRR